VTLSFSTIHYSPMVGLDVPLEDVVRITRDSGFDSIGLDMLSIDRHLERGGSLSEIREIVRRAGLGVSDLVFIPVTGRADEDVRATEAAAAVVEALEIPWCLLAVPEPVGPQRLVESVGAIADTLVSHGCRAAIEFCSHLALARLSDTITLCDAVGWERTAVVIDTLHFARAGLEWDDLSRLTPEQIAYVQISDAPATPFVTAREESRYHRLVPGDGALPLAEIGAAVTAQGFTGPVVAEVLAGTATEASVDWARRIREGIERSWPTVV
jgi:sugar phosphate isomerase/epimerase